MRILISIIILLIFTSCGSKQTEMKKAIFLHHSTGYNIWIGNTNRYLYKITGKGDVQKFFNTYNRTHKTDYVIHEMAFPKSIPYGWNNYPYDYYNIWVKNAGDKPFMEEPTLEILTQDYNVIIFKHCYPVSRISEDTGSPDINSDTKSIENYKLQYDALKVKLQEFPATKFIVWTPAANTNKTTTEEEAIRARDFHKWIINEWDEEGDNIFIWDFYKLETEGELYLGEENAVSPVNPHPNWEFSGRVAPVFGQFIIDILESFGN